MTDMIMTITLAEALDLNLLDEYAVMYTPVSGLRYQLLRCLGGAWLVQCAGRDEIYRLDAFEFNGRNTCHLIVAGAALVEVYGEG